MISKNQFVSLIDALQNQHNLERKFDDAIALVNTSYTVCELAPDLTKAVLNIFDEDFSETGRDIISDYLYAGLKKAVWESLNKKYSIPIKNPDDLYNMLIKYFTYIRED